MTSNQYNRGLSRAFEFGRQACLRNCNAPVFDDAFMSWWDHFLTTGAVDVNDENRFLPFMDQWNAGWNFIHLRRNNNA